MKTRIILLFIAALLMQFTTVSADNYTDGIIKLMDNEALSTFNTEMVEKMSQTSAFDADYFKSQFKTDIAEWMADHYRKNMPENEFNEMVSFFMQPEVLEIQKKILSAVSSSQGGAEVSQQLLPRVQALVMGGPVEDLQEPDCDPELKKEILRWLDDNCTTEGMKAAIAAAKNIVGDNALANATEDQKVKATDLIDRVFSFFERNMTQLLMMSMVGKVDLHDLQVLNSIEKEPFFENYKKTNLSMASDLSIFMSQIITHMKKK